MVIQLCRFSPAKHSTGRLPKPFIFDMLNVNNYFDGKVASISLQTSTLPATVGVMDIGEYQFGTHQHEVMTIINGELSVKLPNNDLWQDFKSGDSFEVAANTSFSVKVSVQTAYFCTYEDK